MVMQMADNIMVGHLGTAPFAGVSFANSIFVIGMAFCICFTQGRHHISDRTTEAATGKRFSQIFYHKELCQLYDAAQYLYSSITEREYQEQ